MGQWDGPGLDAWHAWTPAEAAQRLAGVDVPWCVVGGWSIDLFLGEVSREHGDLEIAVLRGDFAPVRAALAGFVLHAVGDGAVRRLADDEDAPAGLHQNWVLDDTAQEWRMDVMLEPGDADTWIYRRDESIRAPRSFMVGRTADGIPFLQPHGSLLYKAKGEPRPKDEADLDRCLQKMDGATRSWLRHALDRMHPAHPWAERL